MARRLFHLIWLVALLVLTASTPSQGGQAGAPTSVPSPLAVVGDVGTVLSLAPADLKSLPRTRVEIKEDGRTLAYKRAMHDGSVATLEDAIDHLRGRAGVRSLEGGANRGIGK